MMRSKLLLLAALAWTAVFPAPAAAQSSPAPAYTENGFNPRLLDASVPAAERMKVFAGIIALANSGQVRAQDLAGTMYWQGSKIAGSPVAVNLAQARVLLANAAIHGDVLAMAKLGELELAAGRKPEAMVWAQMYARYIDPMAMQRSQRGRGSAYAANLIKRIADAGGTIDKATSANVASMVGRFDKSIRNGIHAFYAEGRHGRTYLTDAPRGLDSGEVANLNGVAEYMVAFDTEGKPVRVWVLDAFPDPTLTGTLRDYLKDIHANAVAGDSGTRYLRIHITHNAWKFRALRAVH